MADAKPVTLHHPTLPDVAVTVAARSVDDWVEQGWVRPKSTSEPTKREAKPATP